MQDPTESAIKRVKKKHGLMTPIAARRRLHFPKGKDSPGKNDVVADKKGKPPKKVVATHSVTAIQTPKKDAETDEESEEDPQSEGNEDEDEGPPQGVKKSKALKDGLKDLIGKAKKGSSNNRKKNPKRHREEESEEESDADTTDNPSDSDSDGSLESQEKGGRMYKIIRDYRKIMWRQEEGRQMLGVFSKRFRTFIQNYNQRLRMHPKLLDRLVAIERHPQMIKLMERVDHKEGMMGIPLGKKMEKEVYAPYLAELAVAFTILTDEIQAYSVNTLWVIFAVCHTRHLHKFSSWEKMEVGSRKLAARSPASLVLGVNRAWGEYTGEILQEEAQRTQGESQSHRIQEGQRPVKFAHVRPEVVAPQQAGPTATPKPRPEFPRDAAINQCFNCQGEGHTRFVCEKSCRWCLKNRPEIPEHMAKDCMWRPKKK